MLDIIILLFLTQSIGQLALQKGLRPRTWKIYLILAWFAGETVGLLLGLMLFGIDKPVMILLTALPCAIGGYHIIRNTLYRKPDIMNNQINTLGENLTD